MAREASWRDRKWSADELRRMYRMMMRVRRFEEEGAVRYGRGDFSGPYHSSIGQEATYIGALHGSKTGDKMTSNHRSHGHQIAMGAALPPLAAEIWGRATGFCGGKGGSMHVADFSVGALGASGALAGANGIATGAALALKLDKTDNVVVCFFGDGAVNEGLVHETMNWAALWSLPVIFLCENNQYSVSMWYRDTTSVDSISKRAAAYGMPGSTVDGQNVLEVAEACDRAIARARAGEGPSLVECMTYRFTEHSLRMVIPMDREGAMKVRTKYRDQSEIDQWHTRDPIEFLKSWALEANLVTEDEFKEIDAEETEAGLAAWRFADESDWPTDEAFWTDTWAEPVDVRDRIDLP